VTIAAVGVRRHLCWHRGRGGEGANRSSPLNAARANPKLPQVPCLHSMHAPLGITFKQARTTATELSTVSRWSTARGSTRHCQQLREPFRAYKAQNGCKHGPSRRGMQTPALGLIPQRCRSDSAVHIMPAFWSLSSASSLPRLMLRTFPKPLAPPDGLETQHPPDPLSTTSISTSSCKSRRFGSGDARGAIAAQGRAADTRSSGTQDAPASRDRECSRAVAVDGWLPSKEGFGGSTSSAVCFCVRCRPTPLRCGDVAGEKASVVLTKEGDSQMESRDGVHVRAVPARLSVRA
jgi:hypothetical protein